MRAKIECEELLNATLPFAKRMLDEFGEFHPYGGYMQPDGETVQVGANGEDPDHPGSINLVNVLRESLSEIARAGRCKATAIVCDVRVILPTNQMKSDAIQICLDHQDNYSAEVFLPYKVEADGRVTYGELFAQEGKFAIFGTNDPASEIDSVS